MGKQSVENIVSLLNQHGFRCERGFPGRRMPDLQVPAAAVNLFREDEQEICIAVWILCPVHQGAAVCEDLARDAADLLRKQGAACSQERVEHDGRADRFSVRLLAVWQADPPEPACYFSINGGALPYAVKFSSRQLREITEIPVMGQNDPGNILCTEKPWSFRLEEQFPRHMDVVDAPQEPFTLIVRRGSIGECFDGCYWTDICREDTDHGLHQSRTAYSMKRSIIRYD